MSESQVPGLDEVLEEIRQVLAEVRERYKLATKIDAYRVRLETARRVAALLAATPRPRARVWQSAVMDARPVPALWPLVYATQPRYDKPPRIPPLDTAFSTWETLALAPVRWFAKPEGRECADALATIASEIGLSRNGVLYPVGIVEKTGSGGVYRFCDSTDCYNVPFSYGEDENAPIVTLDFASVRPRLVAYPATEEVLSECDLDTPEGRIRFFSRVFSVRVLLGLKAFPYTAKRAIDAIIQGEPPQSVVPVLPRDLATGVIAAVCGGVLEKPVDEFEVRYLSSVNWSCSELARRPYEASVCTCDGRLLTVTGVSGFQYYREAGQCLPCE